MYRIWPRVGPLSFRIKYSFRMIKFSIKIWGRSIANIPFRIKYALGLAKDGVDFIEAPYDQYDPLVLEKFGRNPDGSKKE